GGIGVVVEALERLLGAQLLRLVAERDEVGDRAVVDCEVAVERAEAFGGPLRLARAALTLRGLHLALVLEAVLERGDLRLLARDVLERLLEQLLERLALVLELARARG